MTRYYLSLDLLPSPIRLLGERLAPPGDLLEPPRNGQLDALDLMSGVRQKCTMTVRGACMSCGWLHIKILILWMDRQEVRDEGSTGGGMHACTSMIHEEVLHVLHN